MTRFLVCFVPIFLMALTTTMGPATAATVCTTTSEACYDTKTKTQRTCKTKTCTYDDGTESVSVTVEKAVAPKAGKKGKMGTSDIPIIKKLDKASPN
jgi:hypothetical protein